VGDEVGCVGRGARGWGTVVLGTAITTVLTLTAGAGLVKRKGCPVVHNPGAGTLAATTSTEEEEEEEAACGATLTNLGPVLLTLLWW